MNKDIQELWIITAVKMEQVAVTLLLCILFTLLQLLVLLLCINTVTLLGGQLISKKVSITVWIWSFKVL
jgi:hypothetical protein